MQYFLFFFCLVLQNVMNIFASVAFNEDDVNRFKPGELSLSPFEAL